MPSTAVVETYVIDYAINTQRTKKDTYDTGALIVPTVKSGKVAHIEPGGGPPGASTNVTVTLVE